MKYLLSTIVAVFSIALPAYISLANENPIARVYEQLIYSSNISPNQEMLGQFPAQMNDDEVIEWKTKIQIHNLESLIYSALQDRLLEEMNMQPSESEIQSFIDFSIQSEKAMMGEFESQRQGIMQELQSSDLDDQKRASLTDHLKILDQLIESEVQRREEIKLIPNYEEMKKNSLQKIAEMTVKTWKFNKALYEKYGGRVIFQQAGWEPIDAYKAFLDTHAQLKTYEILDPAYEHIFAEMHQYFEMGHSYMDQENADKYFSKPWWDPTFEPL